MEESQNNKDSRENDNSLLKYMNVFVFKTPASNLISHSKGLTSIFNELRKTKLPAITEFDNDIKKESLKFTAKLSVAMIMVFFGLLRFRKISMLNRAFFGGVFFTGFYYLFELQLKDAILNKVIFSNTHYGQEARILTKWFIKDHNRMFAIDQHIQQFRDYITQKRNLIEERKEQLIDRKEKEDHLDQEFIKEMEKEYKK